VAGGRTGWARRAWRELRAAVRATVFLFELMPMLPSGLLERLAPEPVHERVSFPVREGEAVADVFRPARGGARPGLVLCLGVVPAGLEHAQIPRLARALARAGLVSLIYWSPAMQDRRLEPADADDLAAAFEQLLGLPGVDASRCGFVGTCVGASFALLAAARPAIRDRVALVGAFAPYASVETLARAVASRTRGSGRARQAWPVDPLTWQVFTRTLTASLPPGQAERLREEFATPDGAGADAPEAGLDAEALAVRRLLAGVPFELADAALAGLPGELRERLGSMSPLAALPGLHAPVVVIGHDRDDAVIPVEESRRLRDGLAGRAGVHYTEFALFEHADPTKRRLSPWRFVLELGKFLRYVHPLFRL
jgi:hypothetical protein